MNREINFRGKSKRSGEWLYGDLVRNVEGAFAIVPPFEINLNNHCERYEVDEETIGQFTGQYDMNGKNIYESDILLFGNSPSDVCEVKWNNSVAAFCIRFYCENELDNNTLGDWLQCEKNIEIIGNIHDNGKLL